MLLFEGDLARAASSVADYKRHVVVAAAAAVTRVVLEAHVVEIKEDV